MLGVAVIGSRLFGGVSAWGSSTPKGATIYVSLTPNNGATYPVVVVGVIAEHGTATTIDQNGRVDSNGHYVNIVLKQGGFEINSTTLHQRALGSSNNEQHDDLLVLVHGLRASYAG
jgi:hypothetical protein